MNDLASAVPGASDSPEQSEAPTFREVLTLLEAANLLRMHPVTLQAWARAGKAPAAKLGKSWRFIRDDLLAWLRCECQLPKAVHERGRNRGALRFSSEPRAATAEDLQSRRLPSRPARSAAIKEQSRNG